MDGRIAIAMTLGSKVLAVFAVPVTPRVAQLPHALAPPSWLGRAR